jgi:3-oxoacyl-[acyl-carrier protein] reductase
MTAIPEQPSPPATTIITGAGRGIGRAIALWLAKDTDLTLRLISRTRNCEQVATECNALRAGCAESWRWDIVDQGVRRTEVLARLDQAPGPLALVHAAGVLGPTGPFVETPIDAWWQAVETNLGATVRLIHSILPRMLREHAGRIVLFSGGGGAYGNPNFSSYATAKVALVRLTETLAMEIGDRGPIITIIAPGANETDMLAAVRRAGGEVRTTVSIEEPCRVVQRLLFEDCRGLHGRLIHVRDTWTRQSASALDQHHWKLRRVE